MTRAVACFLLGAGTVVVGLATAVVANRNYDLAERVDRLERGNRDLRVRIESLDAALLVEAEALRTETLPDEGAVPGEAVEPAVAEELR